MGTIASDATSQLMALALGKVSAVELLDQHVRRWEATHERVNAVIRTDIDRAREQAKASDQRRRENRPKGPLDGLPMTVKDCLDVETMPASAGVAAWASRKAPVQDAGAVARARRAGAVVWGKTNVPAMASDLQTFNDVFGTTNNPYDLTRTPGGSSGGAAAALALQVTPLEIGSDIGGSLRTPAHYTGVCSLKPTWGAVSQAGHLPPAPGTLGEPDLNVIGPMARSVRDLALLFSVLAGGPATLPDAPSKPRLGLWLDDPVMKVDDPSRAALEALGRSLEAEGAIIDPSARPVRSTEELLDTYLRLLGPIIASGLPDATFRTLQASVPALKLMGGMARDPFHPASWALGMTITHREWLVVDERRQRMERDARAFFQNHDAVLMPVTPTAAQKHNQKGEVASRRMAFGRGTIPYGHHLSWIALATALRLPAAVVRVGETPEGLPIGVQIVGPAGGDLRVLALAAKVEAITGGYCAPPMLA